MKLGYLSRQMWRLMRKNRMYVFAPVLLFLLLAALVAFYVGPGVVVTFIYAGL